MTVDLAWVCNSLLWSLVGLIVGVVLGYLLRTYEDTLGGKMTTAERLRRRQIRESVGIGLLALALATAVVYFEGQDAAQERCMTAFIHADNETSTIRSTLVEDESNATRRVIRKALSAGSRQDIVAARLAYTRALKRIDAAREDNPVQEFPSGVCE